MKKCEAVSEEALLPVLETYSKHSIDRFNCSCEVWMAHRTEGQRGKKGGGSGKLAPEILRSIFIAPQRSTPNKDRRQPHHTACITRKRNETTPGTQRPDGSWRRSGWCLQQEWCWEPLPQDHLPQVTARPDGQTNTGDLRSSTSWFRGFHVRGIINSFAGSERENSAQGRKPSEGPRDFGTWRGNVKR